MLCSLAVAGAAGAACAAAPHWTALCAGLLVQGLGCGGLMAVVNVLFAEWCVPLSLSSCLSFTVSHAHSLILSQCLSFTVSHAHSLILSQCLTLTVSHSHSVSLSQCFPLTFSFTVSLSLPHSHRGSLSLFSMLITYQVSN